MSPKFVKNETAERAAHADEVEAHATEVQAHATDVEAQLEATRAALRGLVTYVRAAGTADQNVEVMLKNADEVLGR
jgi:hypothetical protein